MTRNSKHLAGAALLLTLAASPHAAQPPDFVRPASVLKPLGFEPNRGQAGARTEYVARGATYTVALSSSDVALSSNGTTIRLVFVGATDSRAQPLDPQNVRVHYDAGAGGSRAVRDVPVFGRVKYPDTYPGIDVVYYGHHGELEFDLDLAPGADPSLVRMHLEGADTVRVDTEGALRITAGGSEIRLDPPVLYQDADGSRVPVATHYVLGRDTDVTITLGPYEPARRIAI